MKVMLCFIVLLLAVNYSAFSQDNENEKWYTYWALGYAKPHYTAGLEDLMNEIEDYPGVSRMAIDLDILGFYWPVNNHKTAVGFVINGAGDRVSKDDVWVQINQYLYAFSAMHFINGNIGKGFFLRGDAGFAKFLAQYSEGDSQGSDWGFGFNLGAGYGFPVSPGTRILLNANYGYKKVEGDSFGKFNISVGGLF